MHLIDAHTHLHFPDFQNEVEAVIKRAQDAGVRSLVTVGTDLESAKSAIALADRFESVFAAIGIHPHEAEKPKPEDFQAIEKLTQHPKVIAIGEVGLDYYKDLSPRENQKQILLQFFEMAKRTSLPLMFHIRDAYEEMLELLKTNFTLPIRGVCHCFSSDENVMCQLLDLGLYISFAGPVTYKKSDVLKVTVKACPVNRILIETDAPYLAPQLYRGKRNESAYLVETAKAIAELKGITLEQIAQETTANALRLFGEKLRIN